jgi:peptidoglycan/LPS O-acetylase OafA/YrhL
MLSIYKNSRIQLAYLDGLRGLAALIVFLFHICRELNWRLNGGELPQLLLQVGTFLPYGKIAVAIFIVLSGYCLMLPIVRSNLDRIPGSFGDYFKRRAKRILPPYYAALGLSILLYISVPTELSPTLGLHWAAAKPIFTPGVIISHLFLVHNLSPNWLYTINGAMWSVATEWQIYFFFPLLLLPLWRKFGILLTVVIAFAIGLIPHVLFQGYFDGAAHWYLGLFAMGMTGAVIGFSTKSHLIFCREKLPWHSIGIFLFSIFLCQQIYYKNCPSWVVDVSIGAIAVCILIYCTRHLTERKNQQQPWILQLLESHWLLKLGSFSYSLYLVHCPLFGLIHWGVDRLPISPLWQLVAFTAISIPLGLLISYLFHLVFEKPLMNNSRKHQT